MIGHDKGHVNHTMFLSKTSEYRRMKDAVHHEALLEHLHDNRTSFNRIYIPDFSWTRRGSLIKLEMEFVWGEQMNIASSPEIYYKTIYEDLVLGNEEYGFKDLSKHNFIIREDFSLAFVDLETYGPYPIDQRRAKFLLRICNFPEDYLPDYVSAF